MNSFEQKVDKLIDHVNAKGYFAHKLCSRRTAEGKYLEGEPFDYLIDLPGKMLRFDAKESHELSWHIKPKDIKQTENLKRCKNTGADAFFLIYFYPVKKMLRVNVDYVIKILGEGRKSIKHTECDEWFWEVLK